jgi:hypothetical protein
LPQYVASSIRFALEINVVVDKQSLFRNLANCSLQKRKELVIHCDQEVVGLFDVSHLAEVPEPAVSRGESWTWLRRNIAEHRG